MNYFYTFVDFLFRENMNKYIVTALAMVSSVCAMAGDYVGGYMAAKPQSVNPGDAAVV